jgi:hypothetical protein
MKFILAVLLIWLPLTTFAQQPIFKYFDLGEEISVYDIAVHMDTCYVSANYHPADSDAGTRIYKLDMSGLITDSVFYENYNLENLIFVQDTLYAIGGKSCHECTTSKLTIIKCGKNLNKISEFTIDSTFGQLGGFKTILNSAGNFVIIGQDFYYPNTGFGILTQITPKGNLKSLYRFNKSNYEMLFSICEIPEKLNYLVSLSSPAYYSQTNTTYNIITMDTSLHTELHADSLPIFNIETCMKRYGASLYVSGKMSSLTGIDYGIIKMDTSFNTIQFKKYGTDSTFDNPAYSDGNVMSSDGNIFVGGTINGTQMGLPYPPDPSWIDIHKIDTLFNEKWSKRFGGDAFYILWKIAPTSDGGCLLGCSRYDFTSPAHNDVVLYKFDSAGNAIALIGELPKKIEFIIYPNPATNTIIIEGFTANAVAEVYNISGKVVLTRKLLTPQLDISVLAKGMYFIKLSTKEGSVVRKFVKE